MCEPQFRTPGICRSSTQARVEMRTSSGCDVPGAVTQCIRKSRSLKSGSSDWPRSGKTTAPTSITEPTARYAGRGLRTMRPSKAW